jgi:PAS domain S-box-containing protein
MTSNEDHLLFALNAAQMGTWDWDISRDTIKWSTNVESILGLSPGTFVGTYTAYLQLVYEPDRSGLVETIQDIIAGQQNEYRVEHRVVGTDGVIRWVEGRGQVYRNATSEPVRMAGTVADVTPRKETELAFIRRVNELQTVAQVSTAAATILDPTRLLPEVVKLTQRRFGLYHVHVFLYDPLTEAVSIAACGWQKDNPHEDTHEVRVIPLNQSQSLVVQAARTRQPIVVNDVHADPFWLPNPLLPATQAELAIPMIVGDTLVGVLDAQSDQINYFIPETISVYNILASQIAIAIQNARLHSQTQTTLTRLEAVVQELERKNAELERFTYTVSHDLKSPLITMRGFLGFLRKDAETGNMERFEADLARIVEATNKMQRLLEDLLELSRIGRLITTPAWVPFETIAWEAVAQVTGRIVERGVQVRVMEDLPLVYVDQLRFVEALQNLVDNAVKFTTNVPEPWVEIGVRQQEERIVLYVCDNGIGIEPRYRDKVFGLFDKLDAQSEGTGIGLALVKRIIELHGGKIWVESEGVGQGTCFCFTLPPEMIK